MACFPRDEEGDRGELTESQDCDLKRDPVQGALIPIDVAQLHDGSRGAMIPIDDFDEFNFIDKLF